MKFLVPNYSCLQNPWLGGYRPQIPVLSVLNRICWTPPPKKIPGYATVWRLLGVKRFFPFGKCSIQLGWVWTVGGMMRTGEAEVLGEAPVPVPLRAPQVSQGASAVRGWRLTAGAMRGQTLHRLHLDITSVLNREDTAPHYKTSRLMLWTKVMSIWVSPDLVWPWHCSALEIFC